MEELEENEMFCNRCGQPITIEEYESNINGFCEECQQYEEEQNEDPTLLTEDYEE